MERSILEEVRGDVSVLEDFDSKITQFVPKLSYPGFHSTLEASRGRETS